MIVSEVMNKVATISKSITLSHAAKIMSREQIGSLVLLKRNKAYGIITERDIIKNIDKLDEDIKKVMSKKLITISAWADLEEAATVMKNNNIKRVLVRDKEDKVIGIVTATDIIANADLLNQDLGMF
jgi:CBS domain-containing protein